MDNIEILTVALAHPLVEFLGAAQALPAADRWGHHQRRACQMHTSFLSGFLYVGDASAVRK